MSDTIYNIYAHLYDQTDHRMLGFVTDEQEAINICHDLNDELAKKRKEHASYIAAKAEWMKHNHHRFIQLDWYNPRTLTAEQKKLIDHCFENNISMEEYNNAIKAEFVVKKPEYDEDISWYSYDEIQRYKAKV